MRTALFHGRVLTERGIERKAVVVENGRIVDVAAQATADETLDLEGGLLLPGFVDVQVNGGGGVLFGDAPSVETLRVIAEAHLRYGTTALLPTLISADPATIAAAIAAVDAAIAAGVPGIAGIHIEGPFLNRARKGIHDASQFRELDAAALALLTSARHGRTLVTLAPEEVESHAIRALADCGVIVSAGHTDASYAEMTAAWDAGVSGVTHLFNAMSQMTAREPGVVGAALDRRDAWCGIIADGRHVDPAMLRIALKCKGPERLMLVTDAMPTVGSADKSFVLNGQRIVVKDGVCTAPDGTLAGSDLDMATAFRNALDLLGADLVAASHMASRNPATFLRLEDQIGRIAPGCRADLILLDDGLIPVKVWVGGRLRIGV